MGKQQKIQKRESNALHPFDAMRMRMNQLFQSSWPAWPELEGPLSGNFMPTVETSETDKEIKVSIELPGMTDQDVELTISPDGETLSLSGEKKFEEEKKDEEKNFYHFERRYGSFHRNVRLPAKVKVDSPKAKFKNGVLVVTMKKTSGKAENMGRHIQIEA
jgi:HSP20 family protein